MGDTLKNILKQKLSNLRKISELKGLHMAVTGTILELLNDGSVDAGEKFKSRFTLKDFFEVSFLRFSSFCVTV
jgi:hypothetical protein